MSPLLRLTLRAGLPLAALAAALAWALAGVWPAVFAVVGAASGFSLAAATEAAVRSVVAGFAGGAPPRARKVVVKILFFGGLPILALYATMAACPEGKAVRKAAAAAFAAGLLAPMAALAWAGGRLSREESRLRSAGDRRKEEETGNPPTDR